MAEVKALGGSSWRLCCVWGFPFGCVRVENDMGLRLKKDGTKSGYWDAEETMEGY